MSDDALHSRVGEGKSRHGGDLRKIEWQRSHASRDRIDFYEVRHNKYLRDSEFRDTYLLDMYRLRGRRAESFARGFADVDANMQQTAALPVSQFFEREIWGGFLPVVLSVICFSGFAFAAFSQLVSGRVVWAIPYILVGIFALAIGQIFGPHHVDRR